jgi:hypothetical protein
MTKNLKLSDTQLILLTTASQREDRSLLPPPGSVTAKGEALRKSIRSLINRALAEERETTATGTEWRADGEQRLGVFITEPGLAALEPEQPQSAEQDASGSAPASEVEEQKPAARAGTKQALLIGLLQRDGGASLDQMVAATGWLPHTTRAALTGLKKKGHVVTKDKVDGVTRYSIASA